MKNKTRYDELWLDTLLGIFPKTSEDWKLLLTNVEVSEEAKEFKEK
jgi:hypothetical protein